MDTNIFQEQIFNAIATITEEKMKNLSFDYCIEGVIESDTQNEDGSYTFKCQDSILTAFPLGNIEYFKSDIVYVMAISGDLSKKKIILTAKNRSGEKYIDIAKEIAKMSTTGINYVTNVEDEFVLYSGTEERALTISPNFIPDSKVQSFIRVSAVIESILEPTVGGDYGVAIKVRYMDDTEVEYALTLNEVVGNVYMAQGRQYTIEEISTNSIIKDIVYAKIFIKDFPEDRPSEYVKFKKVKIDFVDSSIADIVNQIIYRIEIFSTNGFIFKNGNINTTLIARIYDGENDITDNIEISRFHWHKIDKDGIKQTDWSVNTKSIVISQSDVSDKATFVCEIADE